MSECNVVGRLFEGLCDDDPKARIIRAAIEEIGKRSIEGARTRAIAEKAGVNLAAINYYFGSKQGLYLEIHRQIAESMNILHADHYARAEAIFKNPDADKARALLQEFLLYRLAEASQNPFSADIILILMKEEFYPTEAFETLYKTAISRISDTKRKLLEIASEGRIKGESANLVCVMLYGQIRVFYSFRSGIIRTNKWKQIGPTEVKKITALFSEILEKVTKA